MASAAWQRRAVRWRTDPPLKVAFLVTVLVVVVVLVLVVMQFRGSFTPKTTLTMIAERSGLNMDPGAKVTYNGVQIGRVDKVSAVDDNGTPAAQLSLDIDPKYIDLIPANVDTAIQATTVFGNKYVSFTTPANPVPQRITSVGDIRVAAVSTEFNSLFETIVDVAQQVDPIKLNQTLTATAEALDGLGDRFGGSLLDANAVLADLNPRMPDIRRDTTLLAETADIYAAAAPDLFDGLGNAAA